MTMVHKMKKVKTLMKKQKEEIKQLEEELKELALEQKKHDLAGKVANEKFRQKHRRLLGVTSSVKKGLGILGREMKKGLQESLKQPKMTKKERREWEGIY